MPDEKFTVTVEVVPPAGPDAASLLAELKPLAGLAFKAFSVAADPVAKPRMSALALCALLQQKKIIYPPEFVVSRHCQISKNCL